MMTGRPGLDTRTELIRHSLDEPVGDLETTLPNAHVGVSPRPRRYGVCVIAESPARGLYALKPWYTRQLGGALQVAARHGVSPDVFTALGLVSAAGAAVTIALGWWPFAFVLLAGRLAGANLDGAVARARGVSRPWGFVLNELGDRGGDLLMFAGLAVLAAREPATVLVAGSLTSVAWVLIAAAVATLPTFASLAGTAAAAQPTATTDAATPPDTAVSRVNGGPFGKTERCAVVVLATAMPAWIPVIAVVIIVGSFLTMGVRLVGTHRSLTAGTAL
jgi:CDP-diacylglycerol--glycerol-3-phosphate 3-phosphatidyltransferase